MASPKVFVSSTCFDLSEVREQLSKFIKDFGFEPILSEHWDVFYHLDLHTHDACIHEVSNCQLFILIIGGRFGGEYKADKSKSVTNAEYRASKEKNIPVFTYIKKTVLSDHYFYIENKKEEIATQIKYPNIEKQEYAIDIFNFIDEVRRSPTNNAFESFDKFGEIESHLRKQWAGMFFDFLKSREIKAQIDTTNHLIEGISSTSNKLEELVKRLYIATNEDKDQAQIEIESIEILKHVENFFTKLLQIDNGYLKEEFDIDKVNWDKIREVDPLNKSWEQSVVEVELFREEYELGSKMIWCDILGYEYHGSFGFTIDEYSDKEIEALFNKGIQRSNPEQREKALKKVIEQ